MFEDRKDAGRKLARALGAYKGRDTLVLAIPRGGVEVGYQVATALGADFSLVVVRKLPFPDHPESGFGAIAEDGSTFLIERAASRLSRKSIRAIMEAQKTEVEQRIEALRGGDPLPKIEGQIVILVDDGIAMGSTMRAAIALCKNQQAGEIVVASPVASGRVVERMRALVDRVVVLETPPFFYAVAQVYRNWYDVSDQEVQSIMARWQKEKVAA